MAETYRAVMLTKAGGPEVLQVVELPVESPGPGQLRVRVRAAGVGSTDLIVRRSRMREPAGTIPVKRTRLAP